MWVLGAVLLVASAFCSAVETALTNLGDARARGLRDEAERAAGEGRGQARALSLWIDHPERVRSTVLVCRTLVNVGAGALAATVGVRLAGAELGGAGAAVLAATGIAILAVLFLGSLVPKTLARQHPVKLSILLLPVLRLVAFLLWPFAELVTRTTAALLRLFGGKDARAPGVTSEEIEYLIERGTREGVLDEVKEELLNSVLEFADRVAREIMVPRTRVVAVDRDATQEELVRIVTENPYSRMPVTGDSIDDVVGVLLVRDIIADLRHGRPIAVERHQKPAFFVPEAMKISRLLKEMQRRRTHLAIVVDEFGGTSGIVTLEDVIEEIVGEIQDEGDVEAAPVRPVAPGVWLADGAIPLHDLEAFLAEKLGEAEGADAEVSFPDDGDYETLAGFVTATAGRVPPVGAEVTWDGLVFTVRAGDERRVTKVEITRRPPAPRAAAGGGP
jgi:CBS domain containing-hemolysin-like protein